MNRSVTNVYATIPVAKAPEMVFQSAHVWMNVICFIANLVLIDTWTPADRRFISRHRGSPFGFQRALAVVVRGYVLAGSIGVTRALCGRPKEGV